MYVWGGAEVTARQAIAIADELLTESRAVARIPGDDKQVRAWLREHVRTVRGPTGLRLYRWAEILAVLSAWDETPAEAPPAPRATLRRSLRV